MFELRLYVSRRSEPRFVDRIVDRTPPGPVECRLGAPAAWPDRGAAEIASGRLRPGDQLPAVVQLAAKYDVAAGTAHRAVALLADGGLIDVRRGRRATVNARTTD